MYTEVTHPRTVKSFVRRQARFSDAQKKALEDLWPMYGLDIQDTPLDFSEVFGNDNPVVLEIGFGNGESLIHQAQIQPDRNFIGIEVHLPGVGYFLRQLQRHDIRNVRVFKVDAIDVLAYLPRQALAGLQLFFPDPWHKSRHNKRRLVQKPFLDAVAQVLQAQGFVHMATDWQDYAEQMLAELSSHGAFTNQSDSQDYIPRPEHRITTKFEARGLARGHGVWDLLFRLN